MAVSTRSGVDGDPQIAVKRATELAQRQFGAIARRQLLRCGFTPTRIRGWVRSGRLHPRYPGVYAFGRAGLGIEGGLSAGLLFAGHGAALGGVTALWWLGLLERRPRLIHVDAPGGKASLEDVLIRHPAKVSRIEVRGLPVVPLPQALLAATKDLRPATLRLVLARAEFRHLLDLGELARALGRGRPGSVVLRAALDTHLPQLALCESPLEVDFVLLCERFRVELPEPQQRIGRWRPDMLWREQRLIVELDGEDAHTTPAQIAADERRESALRRLGYTVVRFTWADVHHDAEAVARRIRRLLAAPSH